MRYRALDGNGDMTFGHGNANFKVNTPAAVAQAVLTRLLLDAGEWFLDIQEGLKLSHIDGFSKSTRDIEVRNRILNTQGVDSIASYASQLNPRTRKFSVQASINTIYGSSPISLNVTI